MVSISVANATFYGEKHHLVNMLRSLVALKPDEVCITDTSCADDATIREFHDWLFERGEEYGLPIKITHGFFGGRYSEMHNQALDMCSSDWTLLIDSDAMLSHQFAHDVREYLTGLPKRILAIRARALNLLDDKVCITRDLWPPGHRRGLGVHPCIYRAGAGHYSGGYHEWSDYPGRKTIPFYSPEHPMVDWNGGYEHCFLHLWMYKDNMMRRQEPEQLLNRPLDALPERACAVVKQAWLDYRCFEPAPVPKGVTWVPIIWQNDPSKWSLVRAEGRWHYRPYYGQGGR